jgi:hypothetical protein
MSFWQDLATNTTFPNGYHSIFSYNLQLYGGADYGEWVDGFADIVPNPQIFLGSGYLSGQNTPTEVQQALDSLLTSYPESIFAFLWRYPHVTGNATAADYAQAISSAAADTADDPRAVAVAHIQDHLARLAEGARKAA